MCGEFGQLAVGSQKANFGGACLSSPLRKASSFSAVDSFLELTGIIGGRKSSPAPQRSSAILIFGFGWPSRMVCETASDSNCSRPCLAMYSDLFAFTMPRELTDMGKFDTSYMFCC